MNGITPGQEWERVSSHCDFSAKVLHLHLCTSAPLHLCISSPLHLYTYTCTYNCPQAPGHTKDVSRMRSILLQVPIHLSHSSTSSTHPTIVYSIHLIHSNHPIHLPYYDQHLLSVRGSHHPPPTFTVFAPQHNHHTTPPPHHHHHHSPQLSTTAEAVAPHHARVRLLPHVVMSPVDLWCTLVQPTSGETFTMVQCMVHYVQLQPPVHYGVVHNNCTQQLYTARHYDTSVPEWVYLYLYSTSILELRPHQQICIWNNRANKLMTETS